MLPKAPPDSAIAPQPRADFVPRGERSVIPLLVGSCSGRVAARAAALVVASARSAVIPWRRRSRSPRAEPPLERWTDAGEPRAVAATATSRLRSAIALRVPSAHRGLDTEALLVQLAADRPDWPLADVSGVLRSLDEARFGTRPASDVLALARSAAELEPRLPGGAA